MPTGIYKRTKEHINKLKGHRIPWEIRKCLGCGIRKEVRITDTWKMCRDCSNKITGEKIGKYASKNFKNKKRSKKERINISNGTKNAITTHHIDCNHNNNKVNNKIRLGMIPHTYIHQNAYRFLVILGYDVLYKYIIWLEKYKRINLIELKEKINENNKKL